MFIFGHAGVSSLAAYLMKRRIHNIDYRYVALGSMLSDIIDKPLGLIILKDVLYNGRLIGHTLLFAFALTVISFTKNSMKLKMLSLGIWLHLLFDAMFLYPKTLLWPVFGNFRSLDYHPNFILQLVSNPLAYVPEAVGMSFLLYVFFRHGHYRKYSLIKFLKTGKLE